ncbi:MAG: sulfatase-like hydrolase/transferase [Haloferula sp.]
MRQRFFSTVCVALSVTCLLAARSSAAAERPNILFIFADDWGWGDLGCHGHPYVRTPNIDRLAEQGTDFHRFTVASGVCSPSRTAVMTGHFPARYSINGHFAWVPSNAKRNMPDWLDTEAPSLPRLLKESGYATAHFGKWHLSNNMIPDSPLPIVYGYDEYGAFNCAGEQMPVHDDAARTIAFVEKSVASKKPFFVNLWIHEPHTPFHVVPKYQQRFAGLLEADGIYAAVLAHADERIGEVLAALDRLGVADNTLVIFSSDNGPARAVGEKAVGLMYDTATGAGFDVGAAKGVTGGRKGYKAALYEGGIGVPFIVRWPGVVKAGAEDEVSLISAVDLLPTFCEAAAVELPDDYRPDGVSQLSVLKGEPAPNRSKPLFWKTSGSQPASRNRPYHWVDYVVVAGNWKMLLNEDASRVELYDLPSDPLEQLDLSEAKPEVLAGLQKKLEAWKSTLPSGPSERCFSSERKE